MSRLSFLSLGLSVALLTGCAAHPGSTSREAVRALEQAGLVQVGLVQGPRTLTSSEYGSAPRVGDGVQFTLSGAGATGQVITGQVIHVTNIHERRALNDYYARLPGSRSAMLGPLVLHVSGDVSGEVLERAQATLRGWQAQRR